MTPSLSSAYHRPVIYEIVVDVGETANKCTITPLASRSDFRIFSVYGEGPLGPLSAPILLHHEGECLSRLAPRVKPVAAIACVDCVWRRLPRLLSRIEWTGGNPAQLAKIPEGFETAYPRVGEADTDPEGGLATIEAIFIAAALLGTWDTTLLSKYYFARQFVDRNAQRFLELGIKEAGSPQQWPKTPPRVRDSLTRRRNRGKVRKVSE